MLEFSKNRLFTLLSLLWMGCSSPPALYEDWVSESGRIVLHRADLSKTGFVVGVPRGQTEPVAVEYAEAISGKTTAGLVAAYGFGKERIPVTRPLVYRSLPPWSNTGSVVSSSVYAKFRELLRSAVTDALTFYVGIQITQESQANERVDIAAAGFTFGQLKRLKELYVRTRDSLILHPSLPRVDVSIYPLDEISWDAFATRNHGVLMLAERGLVLALPKILTTLPSKPVYQEIIASWLIAASALPRSDIRIMQLRYGRMDLIRGKHDIQGVVIGAPHGSFDWHTGELVEELSYLTRLPAVVTRGFTPIECDGWRINVNRPTERRYPSEMIGRQTERAKEVYDRFRRSVFEMANGPLNLYIDIHQNSTEDNIEVATLGVSREQAQAMKSKYYEIRNRALSDEHDVAKVELLIEPLDQIMIGAWAAKDQGILKLAKQSLHFELPAQHIFYRQRTRHVYTKILAELIKNIEANL